MIHVVISFTSKISILLYAVECIVVIIYTFVPFVLLLCSLSIIYNVIYRLYTYCTNGIYYILCFGLSCHFKSSEINSFGLLQILLTQALERFPQMAQSLAQLPSDSGFSAVTLLSSGQGQRPEGSSSPRPSQH